MSNSDVQSVPGAGPAVRVPQAERTRVARQAILEAAAELVGMRGYAKTSLALVGLEAGYSRGIVSYHFRSKEALAHALIDHIEEKNRLRLERALGDKQGTEALESMIDYYCNAVVARPSNAHAIYVLNTAAATSAPELRPHLAEHNAWLRKGIVNLLQGIYQENGLEAPADIDLRAGTIEGGLRGLAQQYLVDPDGFDLRAAAASFKSIARSGVLGL